MHAYYININKKNKPKLEWRGSEEHGIILWLDNQISTMVTFTLLDFALVIL